MSDGEHPIAVLCDTHVIPILMFLDGSGPSRKTDIYAAVGRNSNMPLKLERMAEAGLVDISPRGNSEFVGLTAMGESVAGRLREIDGLMAGDR